MLSRIVALWCWSELTRTLLTFTATGYVSLGLIHQALQDRHEYAASTPRSRCC